jgi:uncharacterized protein (DUF924 family)
MSGHDWRALYRHWFAEIEDSQAWIDGRLPLWFFADPEADRATREVYAPWLESITEAEVAAWKETPRGFLTAILLFDQVPRNAFRKTPRSFAWDDRGIALAFEFLQTGFLAELDAIEAFWTVLPFQHQETMDGQERSVSGVNACAERCPGGHARFFGIARDMARRHFLAVERFGRFPHRNVILDRSSSAEEVAFLQDPKNHF